MRNSALQGCKTENSIIEIQSIIQNWIELLKGGLLGPTKWVANSHNDVKAAIIAYNEQLFGVVGPLIKA